MQVDHNNLPQAIGLLLEKVEHLENQVSQLLSERQQAQTFAPIDINAASQILGLSVGTIYNRKDIPFFKVGGKRFFYEHELREWITKQNLSRRVASIQEKTDEFLGQQKRA